MKFLKDLKINNNFKKGKISNVKDMPVQEDRDNFLSVFATENGIPIIVSSQDRFDLFKSLNIYTDVLRLADNYTLEVKGKEFPNGVLIDESVSIGMITWIKDQDIRIRGGFS